MEEYQSTVSQIPFPIIPFERQDITKELASVLRINCIPNLQIFGPKTGNDRPLINPHVRDVLDGTESVLMGSSPATAEFPFYPRKCGDLHQVSDDINRTKCLVLFAEACDDEEQEELVGMMRSLAQHQQPSDTTKFFWALSPSQMTQTLRDIIELGPPREDPMVVLLHLPDGASYYRHTESTVTFESLSRFLENPGTRRTL